MMTPKEVEVLNKAIDMLESYEKKNADHEDLGEVQGNVSYVIGLLTALQEVNSPDPT